MADDVPRMRVFAGPNGAGKSSAYDWLQRERPDIRWGLYINADILGRCLEQRTFFDLTEWGVSGDETSLHNFLTQSGWNKRVSISSLSIKANVFRAAATEPAAYVAAVLADWLRELLLQQGTSFTTETVMSHPAKLDLFRRAKVRGYRTYLYFVATEDPEIQLDRIARRAEKGGHTVPEDKVTERYIRSLALLPQAIQLADRAFLFDNTDTLGVFAEYEQGQLRETFGAAPAWFAV